MVNKICQYCYKKIEGSTQDQVDKLMLVHKINKHPNLVSVREDKLDEK